VNLGGPSRVTPSRGDTRRKKILGQIYKYKRGRTGKKVRGDTLQGDDTRVKSIKVTVMSKKGSPVFQEKINRGDTRRTGGW